MYRIIFDGCHLQNDTVCFATVFHKCQYKHRTLHSVNSLCSLNQVTALKKPFKFSKRGTPIGIQNFSWPTILGQKSVELWRRLFEVLLFTSVTVIESRPGRGGFVTRNSLSSEDAECFLISSVPVHVLQFTAGLPLQASYRCPQKLRAVEEEWTRA